MIRVKSRVYGTIFFRVVGYEFWIWCPETTDLTRLFETVPGNAHINWGFCIMAKRRELNNLIHEFKYEEIKTIGNLCLYCENIAAVWDHVPPISLAYYYQGHFIKIPSCRSCNSCLTNKPLISLANRRSEIIRVLLGTRENKSIMKTAEWGLELEELTGWLKRYIRSHCLKKVILITRIINMRDSIKETWGEYVEDFKGIKER